MSYPVSGLGKPQGGGLFPLWEDTDFLGGYQVRSLLADRDAIPFLNRKVGMRCYVIETGADYRCTDVGSASVNATWAALPSAFIAGGDLGGSSTSQSVLKVNGVAISGTPSAGYVLIASSASAAAWGPAASGFTAGGDLTGTSTSQTVAKVNGVAVTGTPVTGYVLTATGTAAATWQTAPVGFTAGGDLSGTATNQTVAKVNGVAVSGTAAAGYSLVATGSAAAAWTAPAATPTGTGFTHYIAGVRDAAAKAVDLASGDVTNSLPVASVSGFNTAVDGRITAAIPTGTGFSHITAGVRDSAAKKVDLVNDIDTATSLPEINGGGKVRWATQTTSSSTPLTLATSAAIPSGGSAYIFASVLFHDASGSPYTVDITALYQNNGGTITNVYGPNPSGQLGPLLNQSVALSVDTTAKTIVLSGTNTGGTSVTMVPDFYAKVG